MRSPLYPSLVGAGTLVIATVAVAPTLARASEEPGIPTQLINDPTPGDLNGPCSVCRVHSLKAAEQPSGGAELEIYFEDDGGDLDGFLELTIVLHSGQIHTMLVDEVYLSHGELTSVMLEPGGSWAWSDDVRHVWVEPIPGLPGV